MKRRQFVAALGALAVPAIAGAQTICKDATTFDGGFEFPPLPFGQSGYLYSPGGTPWIFSDSAGIQRNGSAWGAEDAPEGVQTAFLQNASFVAQQIFLPAGPVSFLYSLARRNYGGQNTVLVSLDGAVFGLALPPAGGEWYSFYSSTFVANPGLHTLAFRGINNSGDNTAFLDAVSVAPPA